MRIEVKLYGDAKRYAPGERTQFQLALEPGATLEDALDALDISEGRFTALINGRRAAADASFENGDVLVFIPFLAGG
jgi:sulfur carrier protein ThiS